MKINFSSPDLSKTDLLLLERQLIESCISNRLPNLSVHKSKFESQIVITRLSIKCECGGLKTGEKCATLKPIEEQNWTEYMGNQNNGLFPTL